MVTLFNIILAHFDDPACRYRPGHRNAQLAETYLHYKTLDTATPAQQTYAISSEILYGITFTISFKKVKLLASGFENRKCCTVAVTAPYLLSDSNVFPDEEKVSQSPS